MVNKSVEKDSCNIVNGESNENVKSAKKSYKFNTITNSNWLQLILVHPVHMYKALSK